jgi:integrase
MAGKERKTRKRGQGEGSIYKRKDGLWAAAVNLGYQGGKLRRKVYYGKTREEVQEKLVAALSDVQRGIPIPTERQTVAQFLQSWLVEVVKPSVRPKTLKTYDYIVNTS